jgi:hypothetical protein
MDKRIKTPTPPGYFDGPVPQFSVGDSAPKTQEERLDRQQQDTAALRGVPNSVQPEPSSAEVPTTTRIDIKIQRDMLLIA